MPTDGQTGLVIPVLIGALAQRSEKPAIAWPGRWSRNQRDVVMAVARLVKRWSVVRPVRIWFMT